MKNLRESVGISQEQFAKYLGVTRSQVALVEIKERLYQSWAMLKAIKLMKLLKNRVPQPQISQHNQQQAEPLNKELQERIDECQFQLMLANREMVAMKKKFEQC